MNNAPTGKTAIPHGHRATAGLVRLVSVAAVVTATCALWALPAGAATAAPQVRHATTTTVTAAPGTAFVGARVKLSAKVRSRVGIPTGSVRFTWRGRTLCTAVLHRGSGFCFTRFSRARIYLVVGTYPGNSRFFGSSGTVRVRIVNRPPPPPHPTTTTVTAPSTAFVGAAVQLSAKVTSSGSTPTGTVTFSSGGKTLCSAHLSLGAASCAASFGSAGAFTVTGAYGGDATHARSSGHASVTVTRSSSTTAITDTSPGKIDVGGSFTFHVTVTAPAGTPAATGTVTLAPVVPTTLPGYTCTATLTAGKGSCMVTPAEFGIDNYVATYSGDAAHTGSASDGKFLLAVLNKTTTTVSAPSTTTGSVTLNAAVLAMGANITSGAGGHGSVAFYLATTPGGAAGTVITGCAAVSLTTFVAGNNNATCTSADLNKLPKGTTVYITAVFSGDDVNEPSTSPQFTLTTS
jgi:hypothetical protein